MRKAQPPPRLGEARAAPKTVSSGAEMAMTGVGETIVWVVRHTLRTCLRGMALAVTAVAGVPLAVISLACLALLPPRLGAGLGPKSLLAFRRQAERQRRWAREWSGVTIATP